MEDLTSKTAGKPIRCRAAVARKPGEPLSIEEVIVAPPKSGEVRVRIICSSLCYSDVTYWKMKDPPAYFPRILGHQCFGIVESIGEDVHDVTEGDAVIPCFMPDCRECADCRSPRAIYVPDFLLSFSEYTVVDIAHITKVDLEVPPNRACLLSCGVSTGLGAALRTANVETGSTVAIIGLGAIGLALAEGARLCGAKRIIGVDVNEDKHELSNEFLF